MSSPPPNPDTRDLPHGWVAQYNWDYKQWFYVNTREQPPRSSWEHPLGTMPQGFAPPSGPPPDRSYSRSPYGGGPGGYQSPPQGYGGYNSGYQPSYGAPPQGYGGPPNYANAPSGGYTGGGYQQGSYAPENRGIFGGGQQPAHTQARKSGPGIGTAILAGGAGLVGGALLMDAIGDHDEHERDEGYNEGFQDGFDDNQGDFGGGDW
ncbi:hypothetical protein PAXRUDRAFT_824163 [Paxillus rubicundulus Ve08.2h10]|uniref:WW domain-containing protein n=1 Tax=Paxillus rubicundulus Ve08.2h10 TaxID=930991 RepID=A0A0D0EBS9_9AGAM|nr:hypothetical protein PAXRUDRAFT_824163 [Paxillus rubicundulus Ve08.2h10]